MKRQFKVQLGPILICFTLDVVYEFCLKITLKKCKENKKVIEKPSLTQLGSARLNKWIGLGLECFSLTRSKMS